MKRHTKKLPLLLLLAACTPPPAAEEPVSVGMQHETLIQETATTCMSFVRECKDWTPRQRTTEFDDVEDCGNIDIDAYEKRARCYRMKENAVVQPLVPSNCESKFDACIEVLDVLAKNPAEVHHHHGG